MRITLRLRRCWRMISWPAAKGIRCVKPSSATTSPSCTASWIASFNGRICAKVFSLCHGERVGVRPCLGAEIGLGSAEAKASVAGLKPAPRTDEQEKVGAPYRSIDPLGGRDRLLTRNG